MKEFYKWYVENLDENRLIKLAKEIDLSLPGFSKDLSKAPKQLIRNKTVKFATKAETASIFAAVIFRLNPGLYEAMADEDLDTIKSNERNLIKDYGGVDYVFALVALQEENDFESEEVKSYITELMERLDQQDEDNDKEVGIVELSNGLKEENIRLQKEVSKLKSKLQNLNESFHAKLQKEKSQRGRLEEKYKDELGKINKLNQEKATEISKLKENLAWVTKQKEKLEKELAEKEMQINQLAEQNREYEQQLADKNSVLDLWQAKYPEENPARDVLRAIIIGDKPRRQCKFLNGVPVELKSVDLSTAEEKYINGGRSEEFDLIFLISSRCNHRQRISFLKKFNGLIEVASMKQVENNILQSANHIAK